MACIAHAALLAAPVGTAFAFVLHKRTKALLPPAAGAGGGDATVGGGDATVGGGPVEAVEAAVEHMAMKSMVRSIVGVKRGAERFFAKRASGCDVDGGADTYFIPI